MLLNTRRKRITYLSYIEQNNLCLFMMEYVTKKKYGHVELGQNLLERLRADKWSVYTSPTTLPLRISLSAYH